MSISQVQTVFEDETLNSTKKLIMLSLAHSANDSGVCCVKTSDIREETGLSTEVVVDNLRWLVDNKYIFRKDKRRANGKRKSNYCLIYPYENRNKLDGLDSLLWENEFTKNTYSGGKGFWIPASLLNKDISWTKRVLLAEINQLEMSRHGCIAANVYFAKKMRTKETTISKALNQLEKDGYITINNAKSKKNVGRTITINNTKEALIILKKD